MPGVKGAQLGFPVTALVQLEHPQGFVGEAVVRLGAVGRQAGFASTIITGLSSTRSS